MVKVAEKGKQFERDVANALGHIFPNAERMLEYQASGVIGVDLQNTGEFDIQCKRYAGYAPISKIKEIQVRDPNRTPVLVTKGNNMPAMAVLPFERFISLLERIPGLAQKENVAEAQYKDIETTATKLQGKDIGGIIIDEFNDIDEDNEDEVKLLPSSDDTIHTYSLPAKNEKTLDYDDAIERLSTFCQRKVEAIDTDEIEYDVIIIVYKDRYDEEGTIHLACEWLRENGAIRAMAAIDNYSKQYQWRPSYLMVKSKEQPKIEDTFSFL